MTPVGTESARLTPTQQTTVKNNSEAPTQQSSTPLKVEQNKVTLSAEGKALLAALQELDKNSVEAEGKEKTTTSKVESFAHGALGMDHPDKIKEEEDSSYSAGQYLSAAATVGGILLAIL
ncbi:hypothetical protein [Vibrio mexicanus]|uniref:hypothetical protein n=1 Tax=Vibrio mexicanus TaxID=1004326 RepID=UPI00063CA91D|nr:hypothetical protein [Vibrio mexicanus]